MKQDPPILLLYDGRCGLCHRAVQLLLFKDTKFVFRFAPIEGETAERIKERQKNFPQNIASIILVENYDTVEEKIYLKSDAVIKSLGALGGFWKISKLLYFIPKRFRDYGYDYIARNRYVWFNRTDLCLRVELNFEKRFLK